MRVGRRRRPRSRPPQPVEAHDQQGVDQPVLAAEPVVDAHRARCRPRAATARTVSPPGPSRTRTASAALISSRSTSAARRARPPPGRGGPGARSCLRSCPPSSWPPSSRCAARLTDYRTMLHSYSTTFYRSVYEESRSHGSPHRHAPAHRTARRWWILAVLCLSVLLVVVDNTIVNVALPTISRDLHASTSDLQWVVDAYTLVLRRAAAGRRQPRRPPRPAARPAGRAGCCSR